MVDRVKAFARDIVDAIHPWNGAAAEKCGYERDVSIVESKLTELVLAISKHVKVVREIADSNRDMTTRLIAEAFGIRDGKVPHTVAEAVEQIRALHKVREAATLLVTEETTGHWDALLNLVVKEP